MTASNDLVARLREPWDGTAGSRERRDRERAEAADRIEALEAALRDAAYTLAIDGHDGRNRVILARIDALLGDRT